jgi:hypothetical protein
MQRRRAVAMQKIDDALPPLRGKQGGSRERNFKKLSHCFVARKLLQVESLYPLPATRNGAKPAMHSCFPSLKHDPTWKIVTAYGAYCNIFVATYFSPLSSQRKLFLFINIVLLIFNKTPRKIQDETL